MPNVFTGLAVNGHNVFIVQGIEDAPAVSAGANDAEVTHLPELMRHGGFGDADGRREVANAELDGVECGHDPQPGWIRHQGKKFGEAGEVSGPRERRPCGLDRRAIDDALVATWIRERRDLILFAWSCHISSSLQLYMNTYSVV
jgi:hypothetical protein